MDNLRSTSPSLPLDLQSLSERAGVPLAVAEHYGPLLALIAAMRPAEPPAAAPPSPDTPPPQPVDSPTANKAAPFDLAALPPGLDLWKSHSVKEAADVLGIKPKSVYEIDERELPRCRVGQGRRTIRFLGIDLLCYMKGLAPIDYVALRDSAIRGAATSS